LYLSKKVCRIFGGKVWAERGEDDSIFHFTVHLGGKAITLPATLVGVCVRVRGG
jgi:signal transduction histidine kinase